MTQLLQLRTFRFDATSLSGTAQDFGSALGNPALKISFSNTSDVAAYLRLEGSTTNLIEIPAAGTVTFDETTDTRRQNDNEYYFAKSAQLQLIQVTGAGASGHIIANLVLRSLS